MLLSELAGVALAAAGPGCEALDEGAFRSFVLDAQSAIDRGDIELPTAILEEVEARLPCLGFAPEPRLWADLLVSKAIVEFSRGGDWEDPLAAALRIRPAIDRGVGPSHPMASWEPPPEPAWGPPVPPHTTLYVDGRPSPALPPEQGLWLVQRTDGRFWTSVVVKDASLPPGFLEARIEGPARVAAWVRAGVLGGALGSDTEPMWDNPKLYPPHHSVEGLLGVAADLHVTFYSPFGLLASGSVTTTAGRSAPAGRISAIGRRGPLTVGLGGGVAGVETWRDPDPTNRRRSDATADIDLLRYGAATLLVHGRGSPFDAQVVGGFGPALGYLDAGVGGTTAFGDQRVRLGLDLDYRRGEWVFPAAQNAQVWTRTVRGFLRLDLVFGEY